MKRVRTLGFLVFAGMLAAFTAAGCNNGSDETVAISELDTATINLCLQSSPASEEAHCPRYLAPIYPVALYWADSLLPLQVVVNTRFSQQRFDEIKTNANPIEVVWGADMVYDICDAHQLASIALLEYKIYIQPSDTCLFRYVGTAYDNEVRWGVINISDESDLASLFTHNLGQDIVPMSVHAGNNGSVFELRAGDPIPLPQ